MSNNSSIIRLQLGVAIGYFIIALIHFIGPFFGPEAYSYFGANYLARLAATGSIFPIVAGIIIGIAFTGFGYIGLSIAGLTKSRRYNRTLLWGIGCLLVIRGILVLPQILFLLKGASTFARGLVFSLAALLIGAVQIWVLKKTQKENNSLSDKAA